MLHALIVSSISRERFEWYWTWWYRKTLPWSWLMFTFLPVIIIIIVQFDVVVSLKPSKYTYWLFRVREEKDNKVKKHITPRKEHRQTFKGILSPCFIGIILMVKRLYNGIQKSGFVLLLECIMYSGEVAVFQPLFIYFTFRHDTYWWSAAQCQSNNNNHLTCLHLQAHTHTHSTNHKSKHIYRSNIERERKTETANYNVVVVLYLRRRFTHTHTHTHTVARSSSLFRCALRKELLLHVHERLVASNTRQKGGDEDAGFGRVPCPFRARNEFRRLIWYMYISEIFARWKWSRAIRENPSKNETHTHDTEETRR